MLGIGTFRLKSALQLLELLIGLPAALEDFLSERITQSGEVPLQVNGLDQEQPEDRVAAIRAVAMAGDTLAVAHRRLVEGNLSLVHQEFVTMEQRCNLHD